MAGKIAGFVEKIEKEGASSLLASDNM